MYSKINAFRMQIIKSDNFKLELQEIFSFISKDSFSRANKFYSDIMNEIKNLDFMPFSHRKSIYFNNELVGK